MLTESRSQPFLHRYSSRHTFPSREDTASLNFPLSRRTWHECDTGSTEGAGPGRPASSGRQLRPTSLRRAAPTRSQLLFRAPRCRSSACPRRWPSARPCSGSPSRRGCWQVSGALSLPAGPQQQAEPEPEPRPAAWLERSEPKSSPKRPAACPATPAGQEHRALRCGRQMLPSSGGVAELSGRVPRDTDRDGRRKPWGESAPWRRSASRRREG